MISFNEAFHLAVYNLLNTIVNGELQFYNQTYIYVLTFRGSMALNSFLDKDYTIIKKTL